jgi:phage terminase Nu1 subunit (DNA packaging protein)
VAERYVTAAELAEVMGVSVKTIQRWRTEGMPSETWGMTHTRRYLVSECVPWAQARSGDATVSGIPRRFTVAQRED